MAPRARSRSASAVCSGVYYGHWLKPVADFVRLHAHQLRESKVWLCSSGPLGNKPLPEAWEVAEFTTTTTAPIDHATFGGALDRSKLSFAERVVVKGVHAPEGDFRDWTAIEKWASGIAEHLDTLVVAAVTGPRA